MLLTKGWEKPKMHSHKFELYMSLFQDIAVQSQQFRLTSALTFCQDSGIRLVS